MTVETMLWVGLGLLLLGVVLQLVLLLRKPDMRPHYDALENLHDDLAHKVDYANERLERELREQLQSDARDQRLEVMQYMAEAARTQGQQLDSFATQLMRLQAVVHENLQTLSDSNVQRLNALRDTLNQQLAQLQQSNSAKLDEMRQVVDEKLQSTLERRLGESFKQVAERLELVHKGLGEMTHLAQGVGDLKHLLTNVKTRGIFGETQLQALLEQVFTLDQFSAQVQVDPHKKAMVDFAVRLPGKNVDDSPLWLPIDAKFPREDYERLLDAQQRADVEAAQSAARQLEQRIRLEARSISELYIAPPYTTDFAILFLPSESLYAEVLRTAGLMESLQREYRVTLAGPTTLLSMLNALQMGFRTLALEKRSSEVWEVLGAVKTEFGKFGEIVGKVRKQTQTVLNSLDNVERRNRAMQRALRGAQELPTPQAQEVLGLQEDDEEAV